MTLLAFLCNLFLKAVASIILRKSSNFFRTFRPTENHIFWHWKDFIIPAKVLEPSPNLNVLLIFYSSVKRTTSNSTLLKIISGKLCLAAAALTVSPSAVWISLIHIFLCRLENVKDFNCQLSPPLISHILFCSSH